MHAGTGKKSTFEYFIFGHNTNKLCTTDKTEHIYIYTDQLVINSTCHPHRMVLLWGRKQLNIYKEENSRTLQKILQKG